MESSMDAIRKSIVEELKTCEGKEEVRLVGVTLKEIVNIEVEKRINEINRGMFPNM